MWTVYLQISLCILAQPAHLSSLIQELHYPLVREQDKSISQKANSVAFQSDCGDVQAGLDIHYPHM